MKLHISCPCRAGRMVAPADYAQFAICESEEDGGTRLTATGELDLATAPALSDRLYQTRAERRDVRLDLSKLEFVDCAGMNVIIQAVNDARTSGMRIDLEGDLAPQVRRVAEFHADRLLQVSQTYHGF
jgi:anti-anti-sigma factor